ncbi:MAG: DUF2232 domain-containing protein [Thermoleophilia bacterium]
MSFIKKPVFRDCTWAVAITLALGFGLAFMPLFSLLLVPLLPLPVAFVIARHGVAPGVLTSAVIGAMSLVLMLLAAGLGQAMFGVATGLLILLMVAPVGVITGICLRRETGRLRLFLVMAATVFFSLLFWLGALVALAGMGPVAAAESLTQGVFDSSHDVYLAIGMSEQDIKDRRVEALNAASVAPYLAPSVLLVVAAAAAGASLSLGRRIFDKLGQPFPRDFAFRDLRMHFGFAYMMIVGLVCQLIAPYLSQDTGSAVDLVGINLLIVAEVAFFMQGIAIASFFLWRFKVKQPKRLGVYVFLVLLQVTLSMTSWMGLFDTWIDYRRRFTGQKA